MARVSEASYQEQRAIDTHPPSTFSMSSDYEYSDEEYYDDEMFDATQDDDDGKPPHPLSRRRRPVFTALCSLG